MFAADFCDRVVHHLLVSHQERVFEPIFIRDSFACRKGKGTLAASNRLMEFLRRVKANGHRGAWGLKLDVASFLASIHKETLYGLIAGRMRHPELLWLMRTVLFHDPTTDYRLRSERRRTRGAAARRYPIPPAKSLFGKRNERGLPIGNGVAPVSLMVERALRLRTAYLPRAGYALAVGFSAGLHRHWRAHVDRDRAL